MLKNDEKNYGLISKILHWIFAFSIIFIFTSGIWMVDLTYYDNLYKVLPFYHKSLGMILFVLLFFRLTWKFLNKEPNGIGTNFEIKASKIVHYAMYLLMMVVFITGYLISTADGRYVEIFNIFNVPSLGILFENQESISGEIHKFSVYLLISLVTLHALAALKHHFVNKDNVLKRMIKNI